MKKPLITASDILQDDTPAASSPAGIHIEKFLIMHGERIETIRNLAGRLPQHSEIFFLWTVNSFNAFTFIPFIIKERGVIHDLVLSTYSINIRIIDALVRQLEAGAILNVRIFISDSIRSRLPKVYNHLIAVTEKHPVAIHYAWNHSKITLMQTASDHFVVEGSGNWGENAQFEQYIFLNNKSVFDFRKNAILHGINQN